jgi:hypothetical protein
MAPQQPKKAIKKIMTPTAMAKPPTEKSVKLSMPLFSFTNIMAPMAIKTIPQTTIRKLKKNRRYLAIPDRQPILAEVFENVNDFCCTLASLLS